VEWDVPAEVDAPLQLAARKTFKIIHERDVRSGSEADLGEQIGDVSSTPQSRRARRRNERLLRAINRHAD